MKLVGDVTTTDQMVTFWAKLEQGQGSRIREKIEIDVNSIADIILH